MKKYPNLEESSAAATNHKKNNDGASLQLTTVLHC